VSIARLYWSCDPTTSTNRGDRVASTGVAVRIEDVVGRPLVTYDAESGDRDPLRRQLQQRAQELGRRLEPRMETETMVMALRLVADGVGDTFVPRPTREPLTSRPGFRWPASIRSSTRPLPS
jgi:DNA-binding transcriptional LysR family regulator